VRLRFRHNGGHRAVAIAVGPCSVPPSRTKFQRSSATRPVAVSHGPDIPTTAERGCTMRPCSRNTSPALSVGMFATKASASSRISRRRVIVKWGSMGGSLATRRKSASVYRAVRRISLTTPSGVNPNGAQRQSPLVDRYKSHHIARLPTPVGCGYLIGCKVDRVQEVLRLLARHTDPESYVAGSTLNLNAPRFSGHIDIFHDREERVRQAAEQGRFES